MTPTSTTLTVATIFCTPTCTTTATTARTTATTITSGRLWALMAILVFFWQGRKWAEKVLEGEEEEVVVVVVVVVEEERGSNRI